MRQMPAPQTVQPITKMRIRPRRCLRGIWTVQRGLAGQRKVRMSERELRAAMEMRVGRIFMQVCFTEGFQ